ncbi:MAG: hypothetical protein ACYDBP_07275 [Leptospirales bacterium]
MVQQIPASTIEIEAKVLYPQESKQRIKQIVIKIQSWLFARGIEGKGIEAAQDEPGYLDGQEYQVLLSLGAVLEEDRREKFRQNREVPSRGYGYEFARV